MRDDRVVGALVGLGAIVGVGIVLLRARPAAAAISSLGSPREWGSSPGYASRRRELLQRAKQGDRWRVALARTAPPDFADPAWTDAVARWIGIESGGAPADTTSLGEVGLLQVPRSDAAALGFTQAELDRYVARSTSDDDRTRLSWRYVRALASPAPHVAVPDATARAWLAYMRHGLPLLLRELADQGFLIDGPSGARMDAAWEGYRPSDRVAAYGRGGVGTPGQRVLLRFVTAADVVAGYDRGARWT